MKKLFISLSLASLITVATLPLNAIKNGSSDVDHQNTLIFDVGIPAALNIVIPYAYYPYCFGRAYQKDGSREALRYATREAISAGALALIKTMAKEATGKDDLWQCPSKKEYPVAHATCASARYFLRNIVIPMTVQTCIASPIVNAAIPPKK